MVRSFSCRLVLSLLLCLQASCDLRQGSREARPAVVDTLQVELRQRQGPNLFAWLAPRLVGDSLATLTLARELCRDQRPCTVRFWTDTSVRAFPLPLPRALARSQMAEFSRRHGRERLTWMPASGHASRAAPPPPKSATAQGAATAKAPSTEAIAVTGRPKVELEGNPQLGQALQDLRRFGTAPDFEEPRMGLLRLTVVDPFAATSSTAGNLERLYTAYKGVTSAGTEAIVELWASGYKIGEVRGGGLFVGPGHTRPR